MSNHNLGRINFPFPSSSTSKRVNPTFMQVNEGFTTHYNTESHATFALSFDSLGLRNNALLLHVH